MVEVEYFLKDDDLELYMGKNFVKMQKYALHLKDLKIKKFITGFGAIYEISSSNINMHKTFIIEGEDKLIIEFDNEEDAFYFKMKYC